MSATVRRRRGVSPRHAGAPAEIGVETPYVVKSSSNGKETVVIGEGETGFGCCAWDGRDRLVVGGWTGASGARTGLVSILHVRRKRSILDVRAEKFHTAAKPVAKVSDPVALLLEDQPNTRTPPRNRTAADRPVLGSCFITTSYPTDNACETLVWHSETPEISKQVSHDTFPYCSAAAGAQTVHSGAANPRPSDPPPFVLPQPCVALSPSGQTAVVCYPCCPTEFAAAAKSKKLGLPGGPPPAPGAETVTRCEVCGAQGSCTDVGFYAVLPGRMEKLVALLPERDLPSVDVPAAAREATQTPSVGRPVRDHRQRSRSAHVVRNASPVAPSPASQHLAHMNRNPSSWNDLTTTERAWNHPKPAAKRSALKTPLRKPSAAASGKPPVPEGGPRSDSPALSSSAASSRGSSFARSSLCSPSQVDRTSSGQGFPQAADEDAEVRGARGKEAKLPSFLDTDMVTDIDVVAPPLSSSLAYVADPAKETARGACPLLVGCVSDQKKTFRIWQVSDAALTSGYGSRRNNQMETLARKHDSLVAILAEREKRTPDYHWVACRFHPSGQKAYLVVTNAAECWSVLRVYNINVSGDRGKLDAVKKGFSARGSSPPGSDDDLQVQNLARTSGRAVISVRRDKDYKIEKSDEVSTLRTSRDGALLVYGTQNGKVCVRSSATMNLMWSRALSQAPIICVSLSPGAGVGVLLGARARRPVRLAATSATGELFLTELPQGWTILGLIALFIGIMCLLRLIELRIVRA